MKNGSKACPFCHSRFTFEEFELVDSMPVDEPCLGCERLFAILAESARQKAAKPQPEQAPEVDLSSLSAISDRLRAGRERKPEPFDARMAAAGDRE